MTANIISTLRHSTTNAAMINRTSQKYTEFTAMVTSAHNSTRVPDYN